MEENRQTEIIETELEEIKTSDSMSEVELSSNEELEQPTADLEETTEEIEEEINPRIEKRDQFFEEIKDQLVNQDRLLTKFFAYSDEHCEFDYEEMGLSFEEEEDHMRRTNKLKDKILDTLEEKIETKFENRTMDTLHNMIICDGSYQEENFRVVIEVYEDSFDLEVV